MAENKKTKSFSNLLQQGLGRTCDRVKEQSKKELRHDLLNACLHNLAYDAQCEKSRAEWLFELIYLTDDSEFYRRHIYKALSETDDFWDKQQLYDLVAIWAKQGDKKAKQIIYDTFSRQNDNESWLGGEQIIAIDGIAGLLYVAEIVGTKLLQDAELWQDDYLIFQTSEVFGLSAVMEALETESLTNTKVKTYLDAVKSHKHNLVLKNDIRKSRPKMSIDSETIFEYVEQKKSFFSVFYRFGKNASEKELNLVFEKLLQETRQEQLIRYLWIFKKRQLPKLDKRLLELAKSNDDILQASAIAAFANNKNSSLRDLAIELIKEQPKSLNKGVLTLLINNYQSGDFQLIESILKKPSQNIDLRHDLGFDLIKVIDTQKTLELQACGLWIYENTPCANCRRRIVEILVELKQAPKTLLKECLQDCSPEIRDFAEKALAL